MATMGMGVARRVLASISLLAALGGCAALEGYARHPNTSPYIDDKRAVYFDLNTASKEVEYNATRDQVERRRLRDEIVYARMDVIEFDFDNLERALNGTGNGVSIGGNLAVLVANGIGATTGGEQTKAAMNAISGGIVGAQGAINKDLYYQRTLPALLSQMEANRDKVVAVIFNGLAKPDSEYPLGAAQLDLRRLVRAGSIPSSVGEITEKATEDKRNSAQMVELARNATFVNTPAGARLKAWVMPNGSVNAERMAQLQAWMNQQPETFLSQIPVATFIRGELPDAQLDPIRQRAVADPALAIPQ